MKKLLISSLIAVLCTGAPVVYGDDTHQHEHGSTSDKSMDSAGDSGIAAAHMGKAQERMKQAQALMAKLREAKDPVERQRLMQQHTQAMRDTMGMMHDMKMDKMGCGQGMMSCGHDKDAMSCGQGKSAMGGDHKMGPMGGDHMMGMMNMHQMMEERMEMMQMMMEQMIERQGQQSAQP